MDDAVVSRSKAKISEALERNLQGPRDHMESYGEKERERERERDHIKCLCKLSYNHTITVVDQLFMYNVIAQHFGM